MPLGLPLLLAIGGAIILGQRRVRSTRQRKLEVLSQLVGDQVGLWLGDRMEERFTGKLNTVLPSSRRLVLKMSDGELRHYVIDQIKAVETTTGELIEF